MNALEVEQRPQLTAEFTVEQASGKGVAFTSHVLLSGLHIPIATHNFSALRSVISRATFDRLPTRAINVVSTKERQGFDQQFSSVEERNMQHEYWLGEVASRILSRSKKRRYESAYTQLLGIPVREITIKSRQESRMIENAVNPSRRSKRLPQELPGVTQAIVARYKEYLTQRVERGKELTPREQQFLTQAAPSKELIETALVFESFKAHVHEKIYVPFLKNSTDSGQLMEFILENYKHAHEGRISHVPDITKKAQLLHQDLHEMTGKGHVMVGLIRAAAVIASNTRQKEAAMLQGSSAVLTASQSKEIVSVVKQQRESDSFATSQLFEDVHVLTRDIFTMIKRIEEVVGPLSPNFSPEQVVNRTEEIIREYVEPLFARQSVFSADFFGRPQDIGRKAKILLAHLPEILQLRAALDLVPPQDKKQRAIFVETVRSLLAQTDEYANVAKRYQPEYFLSPQGEQVSAAEIVRRAFWTIPAFYESVKRLVSEHGFDEEEMRHLVRMHIEKSWQSVYAFDLHGQSLVGTRAAQENDNRDTFLKDSRFNFMMVADGAGDEEGGDVASWVMQSVCREVLQHLWENGIRYPYVTEDQAKNALAVMVSRAAEQMYSSLPQSLRDYLFGNPNVIDPQTNEPMQPHLNEVGEYYQTTFTGVFPFMKNGRTFVAVASVGDSRAYVLKENGSLIQLTRDDSVLWSYLGKYPQTARVLDDILNRFDGEIPTETDHVKHLIAVSEAIKREVTQLVPEVKIKIIADTIEFLSNTLVFTSKNIRSSVDDELKGLLRLQQFLREHVWDGIDNSVVTLDSKVTAIANYFFTNRHFVTKFVGIRSGHIGEGDIRTYEVSPGDKLFVTTDGLHDGLSESRFLTTLLSQTALKEQVEALQNQVLASLGCERVNGEIRELSRKMKSVRGKSDDGITVVAQELTRRLLAGGETDEEDTLLVSAAAR